jgi:hypothetical protein
MTKQHPEHLSSLLDSVSARTCRHLRLMKALFELDDPELEQALAVILERLADASSGTSSNAPPPPNPKARRRKPDPAQSDNSPPARDGP